MYQNIFIDGRDEDSVVYLWDDKAGLITKPYTQFKYAYKKSPIGEMTTLFGDKVTKVYGFRENEPGLFESDLPRETRVLTDEYLNDDTPSEGHRVLIFDIEVSMENGLPDPSKGQNPVTAIAAYDKVSQQYIAFLLDPLGKVADTEDDGRHILSFRTEEDLLTAFITYYEEINPTIISGWNIDTFDIPYLYQRIVRVLGEDDANRMSPIQRMKWSAFRQKWQIAGVSCLDYLDLYKKFTYTQQPNYRLDSIGKLELNLGKVEYSDTLDELLVKDPRKFIEYNIRDVQIVAELDKKLKLIELVRGICHVGHVQYEDYFMSSRFLEGTIVCYLHRQGIVVSNKPEGGREKLQEMDEEHEDGFEGAYVKEPIPGRYDWVFSLDLQSLYPSIIMSLNISPETKSGYVIGWDVEAHLKKQMAEYVIKDLDGDETKLTPAEFAQFMEESKFSVSSNGVLYRNDKLGVIPKVLDKWFAERVEYKNLMKKFVKEGDTEKAEYYDRRQHIQKIFLNSLYGVLGLPVFRFYDLDNALAVTATGQDVIKTSAKYVNNYYKAELQADNDYVLYVDTDSLYVSATALLTKDTDPKQFTIDLARKLEANLNKFYDVMAQRMMYVNQQHRFVIKGEAVAQAGFWVAKKRYALLQVYNLETNEDMPGKLKVKGLDVVRSSFPPAFQKFMKQILSDILNAVPQSEVDQKIVDFKNNMPEMGVLAIAKNTSVKNLKKYYDKKNKGIHAYLDGTPAHVKSSIIYNQLIKHFKLDKTHTPIDDGSKIRWVYLKDNPLKLDTVAFKGDEDPQEIMDIINKYVDYDLIFTKEMRNKLQDFYDALGWGKISTEINQNAASFFSF